MVSSSVKRGRTSSVCQCASISPGISVRPPPSITMLPTAGSTGIGAREMRSIRLPRTSTFDGADRDLPVPS